MKHQVLGSTSASEKASYADSSSFLSAAPCSVLMRQRRSSRSVSESMGQVPGEEGRINANNIASPTVTAPSSCG